MFIRVLLTLLILAILVISSTAQHQNDDDPCATCGKGVSIESYNYTTQVHHLDDGTITDMLVTVHNCSRAVQDTTRAGSSSSFHNTTCSLFQYSIQDPLDCTCSNATSEVAPFAPQPSPTALFPPTAPIVQLPTAPSTAPLPSSTGVGVMGTSIIGYYYSIAGMRVLFWTTATNYLA